MLNDYLNIEFEKKTMVLEHPLNSFQGGNHHPLNQPMMMRVAVLFQ